MSEPSRTVVPTVGREPRAEPHAWESAFVLHYSPLCDYVLRFVGSAEAAQELVQDLFLHLWDRRGADDARRLTRPYLFAAARNRALKYLRHRGVVDAWITRMHSEPFPSAGSPEELCLRRELYDALQQAIAELPSRSREVFLLRRRQHLGCQEIATRLGISLGTVKSHMWRAMVALKAKLAPYLH